MNATPVALAGAQAADPTVDKAIAHLSARLELFRIDNTLAALQDSRLPNERLIRWYRGRRAVLARELGL